MHLLSIFILRISSIHLTVLASSSALLASYHPYTTFHPQNPINPKDFSMDSSTKFLNSFTSYFSTALAIFRCLLTGFFSLYRIGILFTIHDTILSFYFRYCGLSPVTIDLDDQTRVHFWTSNHRRFNKPNLVMIHGYGGNSRWQFVYQVGSLSQKFNLYVPDLLFFGNSYSGRPDRTVVFQARCLVDGLKRLGVDRFSVYSISYGGFVAYRMAEMCPEEVEKIVIVSSGVGCSDEQLDEQIRRQTKKIGRDPKEILLPKNPQDLRLLVSLTVYKRQTLKWLPDFFLQEFINVMCNNYREEKLELIEQLLAKKSNTNFQILTQETLVIWGDQDKVFSVDLAYQLQRQLGPKSRLQIIKDTGHAANIDSPDVVNALIASFVFGQYNH